MIFSLYLSLCWTQTNPDSLFSLQLISESPGACWWSVFNLIWSTNRAQIGLKEINKYKKGDKLQYISGDTLSSLDPPPGNVECQTLNFPHSGELLCTASIYSGNFFFYAKETTKLQ